MEKNILHRFRRKKSLTTTILCRVKGSKTEKIATERVKRNENKQQIGKKYRMSVGFCAEQKVKMSLVYFEWSLISLSALLLYIFVCCHISVHRIRKVALKAAATAYSRER